MDILFNPKKDLKACKKIKQDSGLKETKCLLGYVSRAINLDLCMFDFQENRIIIGNLTGHTIAGLPIETIRKEGVNIYGRILSDGEMELAKNIMNEAYKFFTKCDDLATRMELVFSWSLQVNTRNGREITLNHRLVPYKLDDNGDLWLALCSISTLPLTYKITKACIDCVKTGERYDYIDGKFIRSQHKYLTEEELSILGYLADGLAIKQISVKMGLCQRMIERKKKEALDKLGAHTQAAAVYRAIRMGLI